MIVKVVMVGVSTGWDANIIIEGQLQCHIYNDLYPRDGG